MLGARKETELLLELARLRDRIKELEAERSRANQRDELTGALDARTLRARLREEVARARRYQHPLTLAVLAIDDFAGLEAAHGFKAADELLARVAKLLLKALRVTDLVGRTSSAEFAIVMPETVSESAARGLGRVLAELEAAAGDGFGAASASIGVAGLTASISPEGLLAGARSACADAAGAGGGRVISSHQPEARVALRADPDADADAQAISTGAIEALAAALTERDRYTGEHSEAVIEMSAAVARNLGLRDTEVGWIRSAALLHDIGKVAIPDEILHKPGPLTDEEWVLMKQHPVIGERILRVLPGLGVVARIVRHEHERFDGNGYPDGLVGEQIPLGSRIIIAADTYHAITSDRPYRRARSHAQAVEELLRCSGTQFDPAVTAALVGYLYGQRQSRAATAQRPTQRESSPGVVNR